MPRYLVQRSFPQGLRIPTNAQGAEVCATVVSKNAEVGVTWLHSYVSENACKTYCIYDGPSVDAVHSAAEKAGLPIDSIQPVMVLDPYFYRT